MAHSEEQNESEEAIPEKDQMTDLLDKQLLKDAQELKDDMDSQENHVWTK